MAERSHKGLAVAMILILLVAGVSYYIMDQRDNNNIPKYDSYGAEYIVNPDSERMGEYKFWDYYMWFPTRDSRCAVELASDVDFRGKDQIRVDMSEYLYVPSSLLVGAYMKLSYSTTIYCYDKTYDNVFSADVFGDGEYKVGYTTLTVGVDASDSTLTVTINPDHRNDALYLLIKEKYYDAGGHNQYTNPRFEVIRGDLIDGEFVPSYEGLWMKFNADYLSHATYSFRYPEKEAVFYNVAHHNSADDSMFESAGLGLYESTLIPKSDDAFAILPNKICIKFVKGGEGWWFVPSDKEYDFQMNQIYFDGYNLKRYDGSTLTEHISYVHK